MNILGISGSLRQGSYNTALLRVAQERLPAATTLTIADLSAIPLFNQDVEKAGMPASVRTFREQIATADALLIATPEYNYSIPGVLKNAIDWASRGSDSPLNNKPLAIMGAGGGFGTLRAQLHLRDIVLHNQMPVVDAPQVLVSRVWEKFDDAGNLTDERTRNQISQLLQALVELTTRQQLPNSTESAERSAA